MTSKRETHEQVTYFMDQKVSVRDVVEWLDSLLTTAKAPDIADAAAWGSLQKFVDRKEGRPWPAETRCYSARKADDK